MTFSIIHATARLNGWQDSANAWLTNFPNCEYILIVDEPDYVLNTNLNVKLVYTDLTGLPGCIRAYNTGAKHSTNDVLLLNSDDMFPQFTEEQLVETIGNKANTEFVVGVDAGNPEVFTFQILSRQRYEKLEYALNPKYYSLYGDTEFTYHAIQDNVVIPAAHLKVEHRHPCFGYKWDEVYLRENQPTWLQHGKQLFESRKLNGFKD